MLRNRSHEPGTGHAIRNRWHEFAGMIFGRGLIDERMRLTKLSHEFRCCEMLIGGRLLTCYWGMVANLLTYVRCTIGAEGLERFS